MHAILILLLSFNCFAQSVADLESKLKSKPDDLIARIQLASAYNAQGNHDKVISTLNPYTDQLNANAFLLLAGAYAKKNDYQNEVRVLNFLASKEEENFQWQMLLGQAHLKQASVTKDEAQKEKELTSGIQKLRRAMQLNPRFKPAFDLLLKTFVDQRRHNDARELLMEGITKFGRRPELFRELCRIDATDGFLVQAVSNCTESIKVSPNYPDSYVYLIQALSDQKENQQAEKEAIKAAKKFPKSDFVQWAAGMLFFRKKNYPVSLRYFETALAAKNTPRNHYGLAQALFESGEEARALPHFVEACKSDATTVDTFMAAGGRLKQKGNYSLGTKFIQSASSCRNF